MYRLGCKEGTLNSCFTRADIDKIGEKLLKVADVPDIHVTLRAALLDILLFGAPAILQSDNGSEFTPHVIRELKDLWPDLIMVHGKPRHLQSQGSVERANGNIKDMFIAWMSDNNTQDWSIGVRFVQNMKNSAYRSGIKLTPYKAMFVCDPKVGLTSSYLPSEVLERLQTEDDLLALISEPTEDEVSAHTSPTADTTASTNTTHPTPDPTTSVSTSPYSISRHCAVSTSPYNISRR
ncbi:KRAB-A domain-containing protein 2-like [Macrobrachium nipponense]|uniref:KRAB-A domain-containing protein 2-like n=1 Tax=Macrobrachium nipponense TaxID=159736 RepID=UPI0030C89AB8